MVNIIQDFFWPVFGLELVAMLAAVNVLFKARFQEDAVQTPERTEPVIDENTVLAAASGASFVAPGPHTDKFADDKPLVPGTLAPEPVEESEPPPSRFFAPQPEAKAKPAAAVVEEKAPAPVPVPDPRIVPVSPRPASPVTDPSIDELLAEYEARR